MHSEIYDILINQDEITWQTLLMDLIRSNRMNPWDIDISLLSNEYIKKIKLYQYPNNSSY